MGEKENEKHRNTGGRFAPEHTDREVLAAVRAHEPAATSEVGGELGITRQGADQRLRKLRDAGRVNSKKIGASLVWFSVEPAPATETESAAADGPSIARGARQDGAARSALEAVDFPAGRDRADCEAAIDAARDYLRDHGPASMRELVVQVMPEYPVGYEVPEIEDGELLTDRYRGAWWRKVVKPGLQALPTIESPVGGGKWRYTEDDK